MWWIKNSLKKYYFVKILQSKLSYIFLIVRKRKGRLIGEEKDALHRKIREIAGCVYDWNRRKFMFLSEK